MSELGSRLRGNDDGPEMLTSAAEKWRCAWDLALETGRYGRVASLYNLLSECEAFGLSRGDALGVVAQMEQVVRGWRQVFTQHRVEERSMEHYAQAILPECFFRMEPADAVT